MKKKGWLVVSGFLQKEKFTDLYAFLGRAATACDVALEVKKNTELFASPLEKDLPDFVLFWDKDVSLARRLEKSGVPLFNRADAIEICDSKILTAEVLADKVATPKTLIAPKTYEGVGYVDTGFVLTAVERLGLPMIIKEEFGSFGAQVYLAKSIDEATKIVKSAGCKGLIFQQFIKNSIGRDVRINVVGGRVHSAMLRENPEDFRSNISGGGRASVYEPTKAQAEAAIKACEAIGLDFAGVDVLFGEEGTPIVCEVNSNPHFKSTYDCTGKDMSISIIEHILEKLS